MYETLLHNLRAKGYGAQVFSSEKEVVDYLVDQIQNTTVAFGGSMTLEKLGLYERLSAKNHVSWHWRIPEGKTGTQVLKEARDAVVYVSSANAIATSGEIVNIDGNGNRVAEILYGHERVYFVVGKNKISKDLNSAMWRAKNIAAPLNALRLRSETPCAKHGAKCFQCRSPQKICRATVILNEPPLKAKYEVLIVDQVLGY